jgi:hypothetical protein
MKSQLENIAQTRNSLTIVVQLIGLKFSIQFF